MLDYRKLAHQVINRLVDLPLVWVWFRLCVSGVTCRGVM
jgi:hypothetical protein